MKRKESRKIENKEPGNFDNLEFELKLMENELFSWLISSAYQSYSPEIIQKKIKKTKINNSKRSNNKKTKGA